MGCNEEMPTPTQRITATLIMKNGTNKAVYAEFFRQHLMIFIRNNRFETDSVNEVVITGHHYAVAHIENRDGSGGRVCEIKLIDPQSSK